MTRFGKLLAGIGLLILIAFFSLVRCSPGGKGGDVPGPVVARDPAVPASTALIVPVAGVPASALVDTYGDPRGDGTRGHGALDIMAPRGTPVVAAAAGTIEKVFESEAGGYTIYVRSPDRRTVYYYAHLDTYAPGLAEGGFVAQGERIATVGSTGNANPDGPHLHFEIKRMQPGQTWYEGTDVNPYPLLAGAGLGG